VVRSVRNDQIVVSRVRQLAEQEPTWVPKHVERPDEPTVNELAFRLRSCGLAWQDLALETPALEHALAVADRR
jgi:hypothetical protein